MSKLTFTAKPFKGFLYRWAPETNEPNKKNSDFISKDGVIEYCNAIPYSQGEDSKTGYCYRVVNTNGVIKKLAYVTCDYVR